MKCLSRIEIQEYIDRELDPAIEDEIKGHLENCKKCLSLYLGATEDKSLINKLLGTIVPGNEIEIIPEFKLPGIQSKKVIFIRVAIVLAAASLIGLIFLFRFDRKPVTEKIPEAEMIMYEYLDGKDLNKLWHDKSQIFIFQDEQGNVIQTTITY
jgi:hypothetical protein